MCKLSPAFVALVVLALSNAASAGVIVTAVADDVGDGLNRYTVNIESTDDRLIGGMDITFTATSLHQQNPLGYATVFQDYNALMGQVGMDPTKDSQFMFVNAGLANLLYAPDNIWESSTTLRGQFVIANGGAYTPFHSRDVAQIVVPRGTAVYYEGYVSYAKTGGQLDAIGGVFNPEPTSLALLGLGGILCLRRCRA